MGGDAAALPAKPPPKRPPKCDAVDDEPYAPGDDDRYTDAPVRPSDHAPDDDRIAIADEPCGARAPMATAVDGRENARACVRPRLFSLAAVTADGEI